MTDPKGFARAMLFYRGRVARVCPSLVVVASSGYLRQLIMPRIACIAPVPPHLPEFHTPPVMHALRAVR